MKKYMLLIMASLAVNILPAQNVSGKLTQKTDSAIWYLRFIVKTYTWIPIASRIESTRVFLPGILPIMPGISTISG